MHGNYWFDYHLSYMLMVYAQGVGDVIRSDAPLFEEEKLEFEISKKEPKPLILTKFYMALSHNNLIKNSN